MGHVPRGTLCLYCGEHEALYIPDGAWGTMCTPCQDLLTDDAAAGRLHLRMRWRTWAKKLAKKTVCAQAVFGAEADWLAPYLWRA